MEKTICDESNGLRYELRGDYYTKHRAGGCNPRRFSYQNLVLTTIHTNSIIISNILVLKVSSICYIRQV